MVDVGVEMGAAAVEQKLKVTVRITRKPEGGVRSIGNGRKR